MTYLDELMSCYKYEHMNINDDHCFCCSSYGCNYHKHFMGEFCDICGRETVFISLIQNHQSIHRVCKQCIIPFNLHEQTPTNYNVNVEQGFIFKLPQKARKYIKRKCKKRDNFNESFWSSIVINGLIPLYL